MPTQPQEVDPTVPGTEGDDVMIDTVPGYGYYGYGGNDLFVASANNGDWNGYYYDYRDNYFGGGSGSDTITYEQADKPILASLETGIVHYMLDGYVQSSDDLDSIENMIG